MVSECTATQVAGVVSIRCGLCSTGARQTSVAIKSDKGFCVHSHIPQPPDDTQATAVPVQALDMGHIVVDIDGVNITELINKAAEKGYSLRVVDDRDSTETPATYASPHQLL